MVKSALTLSNTCAVNQSKDPFFLALPKAFDAEAYRARHADLRSMNAAELETHYRDHGLAEGRCASTVTGREDFIRLLAGIPSVLEIGPLANPMLRGSNVKYFDVLPTEALKRKVAAHGLDVACCPSIDFVSETGDLGVVTMQFDAVTSSHAIEHQPDLIHHLAGVARVLRPGGRYYLIVPDKRYCFDHFIATSTIADILDAHLRHRRMPDPGDVIAHLALTTHNDPARHWNNDHGESVLQTGSGCLVEAVAMCEQNPGVYIDTHAWQFTPATFVEILKMLAELRLSRFKIERTYPTLHGSNEFYVVLEKTSVEEMSLSPELPGDFDPVEYLRANPDVAAAGVDAAQHYLDHGRREGRRLRI